MPLLQEGRRVLHDPGHEHRVDGLEARHLEPRDHLPGGFPRALHVFASPSFAASSALRTATLLPVSSIAEGHAALADRPVALRVGGEELEVRALAVVVEAGPGIVAGLRGAPLERRELGAQVLRRVGGAEGLGVEDAIDMVQIDGGIFVSSAAARRGETGGSEDHREDGGPTGRLRMVRALQARPRHRLELEDVAEDREERPDRQQVPGATA